nr:TraB/GumN family protein [Actibacterium sp. 188UL27-1]
MIGVGPAAAQAWFDREACLVEHPRLDPVIYAPDRIEAITRGGAAITGATGRFWRVTAPNGAASHIWGTMHSNDPAITRLPETLTTVLKQATVIAVEQNPLNVTRAELRERTHPDRLYYRSGVTRWPGKIDPRVRDWIESRYRNRHLHPADIYRLRAPAVFEDLLWDTCNDFGGGALPLQDDRILMTGLDAGARIVGLEDPDQFYSHYSVHYRQSIAGLEIYGAALQPTAIKAQRAAQFHLYLTGQIGAMIVDKRTRLDAFFGTEKAESLLTKLNGWLIDERNAKMLETATPHLQRGGLVMAIGAFHLPGEKGLLQLLRRAGYRVERIRTAGEVADPLPPTVQRSIGP